MSDELHQIGRARGPAAGKKAPTESGVPWGHTSVPNDRAPYAKNVIVLTSGKGGVGKSTVAVNLASALAQRDYRVGILDADVYGPSVPRMLQVEGERLRWNDDDKIEPSENFGLKIMSAGLTTPEADTPLIWRSSVATSAMIQLLEDVAWGELDFLLIDMPPGTGDTQLTMAQELRIAAAIVVTTPQTVATDDVRRAIRMLKDVNVPVGGVVENMSCFIAPDTGAVYWPFGKGGGRGLAEAYEVPFLGEIPLDVGIREACDQGTPIAAVGDERQKGYFHAVVDQLFANVQLRL